MGNTTSTSVDAPSAAPDIPVVTDESRPEHNYRRAHVPAANGLAGDLLRSGNYAKAATMQDHLGRGDLQVLSSTVQTRLTDIAGDSARQVNNALYNERQWAEVDLLPMAGLSRFNKFATHDLRGDPITPSQEGYAHSNTVAVATRFGGSEEFMQRRVADSVAPVPSLLPQAHLSHGGGTHRIRGAQGFDYISY